MKKIMEGKKRTLIKVRKGTQHTEDDNDENLAAIANEKKTEF